MNETTEDRINAQIQATAQALSRMNIDSMSIIMNFLDGVEVEQLKGKTLRDLWRRMNEMQAAIDDAFAYAYYGDFMAAARELEDYIVDDKRITDDDDDEDPLLQDLLDLEESFPLDTPLSADEARYNLPQPDNGYYVCTRANWEDDNSANPIDFLWWEDEQPLAEAIHAARDFARINDEQMVVVDAVNGEEMALVYPDGTVSQSYNKDKPGSGDLPNIAGLPQWMKDELRSPNLYPEERDDDGRDTGD